MTEPVRIVADYLSKWEGPGGWRRATLQHFSDDSVYENIGMSKSEGLDEIIEFLDFFDRSTNNGWMVAETKAISGSGDTVLTERIDHIFDGQGNLLMATPVMGAFEVRSGKIVAWRDYFDTGSMPTPYDGPGALATKTAGKSGKPLASVRLRGS
jgi:limonene-1,2-epoxide hydrolase